MDRRRLLLILAVFVALIGTALVFLYVQGADKRAQDKFDNVQVLKATQDIAAGTKYDDALAAGQITLSTAPKNDLSPNAVTSTESLKGTVASVPIFSGQQIITSQFGTQVQATSTPLPIPKGMIAIAVNLSDPDRVAGNIQNGSDVAIFVTGTLTNNPNASTAGGAGTTGSGLESTRLLLPKVTVLNVGSPQPPTTSTTTDENGTQTTEQLPRTLLTLAVTQQEAQKVILSSKTLSLTFGLLTPTSNVHPSPGTTTLIQSLFGKQG
jgi:pilus assembly protein CpaB